MNHLNKLKIPYSKAKAFFLRRKFLILFLIIIVGIVVAFLSLRGNKEPQYETGILERGEVTKIVSESGTVEPVNDVELAFTVSGRIASINTHEGGIVQKGQVLASLESARASADLLSAQARLKTEQASSRGAGSTREQTIAQQDRLVQNAKLSLISEDLQAYPAESQYSSVSEFYDSPTIEGNYSCEKEGEYQIKLYSSHSLSGYSFNYSGIESGTVSVSTSQPLPLGKCGLYIKFPEDFADTNIKEWIIPVPNVRSFTYLSRLNAYRSATESRDLAIQQTETSGVHGGQIEQAEAAVQSALAALSETRIIAPFSGLVTNIDGTRGEIASPGSPVVTIISNNSFEIAVYIPEDDISEINVGDEANVSFDAYDDLVLKATVSSISPQATITEGAASFKIVLQLVDKDPRIIAGLSSNVDIIAAKAEDVIMAPSRAILEEDGKYYVRVITSENSYKRIPVEIGLRGEGSTEIKGGVKEGDKIITFANDKDLASLIEER